MEIAIPKSLEALVRRKVEEGHYSTEAEVVADAPGRVNAFETT